MNSPRHGGPPRGPQGLKDLLDREGIKDYIATDFGPTANLRPQFLDQWADKLAIVLGRAGLKKHQLRAFFNEVKRIQTVYRGNRDDAALTNKLLSLKAQAHLRENRDSIPKAFADFIEVNVQKAKSPKEFEKFVQHFEAVLAYCEGRLERN